MNQQQWNHLNAEVMGIRFTWTIDRFTSRYTAVGEKFCSTAFFTGKDYRDEWCLELYPKGQCEGDKDYLCLALRLMKTEKVEIRVDVKYSLISPNTEEVGNKVLFLSHQVFVKNMSNRVSRILEANDMLSYLNNGSLQVVCEITPTEIRTKQPIFAEETGSLPPRMRDQMWRMFENPTYTDTVIIVDDTRFHVHKLLLQVRSPVFAAMFEHDLREAQTNEIKIDGIAPEVVRKMLQFIYTDRVDHCEDIVRDLLVAADRYSLDGLTALCEQVLCEQVNSENAIATLILAERHNTLRVKKHVAKFINANHPEIIETAEYKTMEDTNPALVAYLYRELRNVMCKI